MPKINSVVDELGKTRNIDIGIDNLFHAQLFDWACGMEDLGCVNKSLAMFEQWKEDTSTNPYAPT